MKSFIKKHKKIIGYILLFLVSFLFCFCYSYFLLPLDNDEIWNYGFSYNISKGMIIYKDFNVLQTPLYFFISSIFIKIFGNYLFSLHVFDAILVGFMMILMFKMLGLKSLILLPLYVVFCVPSYNLLCLFWLHIILFLLNKEGDKDVLIGIIVGLSFITKQNIGICLFIPYLIYSRNKLKSIVSFSIPIIILLVYLIYNNALFDFINYCFLGIFDFGNKNGFVDYILLFIECLIILYIGIKLLKSKFKDKELFYILMFQLMIYPICNAQHFLIVFPTFVYCYLKNVKSTYAIYVAFVVVICYFVIRFSLFVATANYCKEKNFLYLRNDRNITYRLNFEKKFMFSYIDDFDYYFIIMSNTYLRKLYMNKPIDEYSFLLNGNIGYNGGEKYIEGIKNICNINSCVFFVDERIADDKYTQFNKDIFNYIINNYNKIDSQEYMGVYFNEYDF